MSATGSIGGSTEPAGYQYKVEVGKRSFFGLGNTKITISVIKADGEHVQKKSFKSARDLNKHLLAGHEGQTTVASLRKELAHTYEQKK